MEFEVVRWNNEHNIHVKTGVATQEQLQASVDAFKTELVRMFPKDGYEKCEFIVNLVTDIKGNSYRIAYLWVSDPRVYYILTGFNPDGSERIKKEEVKDDSAASLDDSFNLESLDLEDAFSSQVSKVKKPTIQENLPPILTLPGYEYTEEQKKQVEELKKIAIAEGKNIDDVDFSDYGCFETSRAWAGSSKKNENPSILCAHVPLWVTEDILKKIFFRYSTDKSGIYPKISFHTIHRKPDFKKELFDRSETTTFEKKLAIVEFSRSHSKDGIFALQMTRKIQIRDPVLDAKAKKEGIPLSEIKPVTLIFGHFKSEEDPDKKKYKK